MSNCEDAFRDSVYRNRGIFPDYRFPIPTEPQKMPNPYPVYYYGNGTTLQFPKDTLTKREQILDEAKKLIISDRQEQYGPPEENFQNIADAWNIRFKKKLNEPLTASDVAAAMALLKIVRDVAGYKEDSAVDAAAYIALYAELAEKENKA